ncbi:hypothetical protein O6H91_06G019700 [Diphasiastrum complanatum]|uniref:Uncharacterized protein n=1 Tax=Diphasiastrum complanatum TaxID=34168 RepID=A0ACC2DBG9_DIPCM|nr:hypothetical protein O6H91_06G019700 [Diphasiastrum complanatum]
MGGKKEGRTVVVTLDKSPESEYALRWVLKHLVRGRLTKERPATDGKLVKPVGDTVVLLHSRPVQQMNVSTSGKVFVSKELRELMENLNVQEEDATEKILSDAIKLCNDYHVNATTLVEAGDPRNVICDAVKNLHADVLVMGSHSYSNVQRSFLGSVSDYCAHNSNCTILIVKKPMQG